jgi:hypothetical protein
MSRPLRFLGAVAVAIALTVLFAMQDTKGENEEVVETPIEKLRRTFAGLRALATAVESYSVDTNRYPTPKCEPHRSGLSLCTAYELGEDLRVYATAYPRGVSPVDAWGNPYLYWHTADGQHYAWIATGSDGTLDDAAVMQESLDRCVQERGFIEPQYVDCFEADLLWCDGQAVWTPADELKACR